MNTHAAITIPFLLVVTMCVSEIHAGESNHSSDIKTVLNDLLPEGFVKAELIGGIRVSPKSAALVAKFRLAIQKNADSILNYLNPTDSGQSRPDPAVLGMTEEEIEELGEILSNSDPVKTEVTFEIVKSDTQISFKTDGTLAELESITINLRDLTISIGEYTLSFADTVNITNEQSFFEE